MSPVELMFVRKLKSVFDKLIAGKRRNITMNNTKYKKIGETVFVRVHKTGKQS